MPLPRLRTALIGGACIFAAAAAEASTITFVFDGTTDSGSLAGESYSGNFGFDDSGLTLSGFESVPVQSLAFSFLATDFGLDSASASADFQDGVFLGLSYTVAEFDPRFSLIAGLADSSDAYLAYTPSTGSAGFGSVRYTVVPLPAGLVLLPGGLALLASFRRRPEAA